MISSTILVLGATNRACTVILKTLIQWPSLAETVSLSYYKITLTPDLCARIPNHSIADTLRKTLAYVAWAQDTGKDEKAANLHLLTHPIDGHTDIQINVSLKGGKTVQGKLPIECLSL